MSKLKITQPVDGTEIPVSYLTSTHVLYCDDRVYRQVRDIDYVYDIDAATMSREYAIAICENNHKQLVRGHVYVFTGSQQESKSVRNPEASAKKKKRQQSVVDSSGSIPPDDVA